jgi:hypothetical protein
MITTGPGPVPRLDGLNLVFGRVTGGMTTVRACLPICGPCCGLGLLPVLLAPSDPTPDRWRGLSG